MSSAPPAWGWGNLNFRVLDTPWLPELDWEGADTGLLQAQNTWGVEGWSPPSGLIAPHECVPALLPVQSDNEGEARGHVSLSHIRVARKRAS